MSKLPAASARILQPAAKRVESVRRFNAMACRLLGEMVQTTLGPRAMDKVITRGIELIVTSDGFGFLENMGIDHPAGKMVVEASKWVHFTVGDGTTSAAVLTAALVENGHALIVKGVHPSHVIGGFLRSLERSEQILHELALPVDPKERSELLKVVSSCIATKIPPTYTPHLAKLVVEAALLAAERTSDGGWTLDLDNIPLVKKKGGSVMDSEMVNGVAIYREPTSHTMPRSVDGARIAYIGPGLEIMKPLKSPEIIITRPEQLKEFTDAEHKILMERVDRILATGANVIVCGKGLDDYVQIKLGRMGILAVRRAEETDMKNLVKATGGRIVHDIESITPDDLGYVERIRMRQMEHEDWMFFEGCKNPRSVSLLLRGGAGTMVDDLGRTVRDALMVIKDVFEMPRVVAGGGAVEMELAFRLKAWARRIPSRQQLAALKFAEVLETIPLILARSAGMNTIDVETDLRAKHAHGHKWFGVDALTAELADMYERSVLDSLKVKLQVIRSATETAVEILRVDDMVLAAKSYNVKQDRPNPLKAIYGNR